MFFQSESTSEFLGRLVRTQVAEHYARVFDLEGFGWNLKIYISNESPGDTDAAGPGKILQGPFG